MFPIDSWVDLAWWVTGWVTFHIGRPGLRTTWVESSDRHFLFSLKVCMNCQQNGLDNSWKAFPTVLSDRVFVFLFYGKTSRIFWIRLNGNCRMWVFFCDTQTNESARNFRGERSIFSEGLMWIVMSMYLWNQARIPIRHLVAPHACSLNACTNAQEEIGTMVRMRVGVHSVHQIRSMLELGFVLTLLGGILRDLAFTKPALHHRMSNQALL